MSTVTRRTVLGAAAATAATTALARPAIAATPTNLPSGVTATLAPYVNWSGGVSTAPLWTATASTRDQLVGLADWASRNGWRLRPTGFRHTWAPTTVENGESSASPVLLVDTRPALTGISVTNGTDASVRVGAGVSMEDLLATLSTYGLGFANVPAPGDITVGGALALACHGTSVAASGEVKPRGLTYGTLSNAVLSVSAIVYDSSLRRYVRREYSRAASQGALLAAHVGRGLITDVTLRVGRQPYLRCVSITDIPAAELLGTSTATGVRSVESFLRSAGRIEVLWFPFTDTPWLKYWKPDTSGSTQPPAGSRPTTGPYNYVFADDPRNQQAADQADLVHYPERTPYFSQASFQAVKDGLDLTYSRDLWGPAYHTQLYVRPTALKVISSGHAILCRRADVQQVISSAAKIYNDLLQSYAAAGKFPINAPFEIRVTGADQPADANLSGARTVLLSPARKVASRSDLDTVVWVGALTQTGTPGAQEFFKALEAAYYTRFNTSNSVLRVEWSKGWAFARDTTWTETQRVATDIPASFTSGQSYGSTWTDAVLGLNMLDASKIYTSPMLKRVVDLSSYWDIAPG